jgi:nucleoside-diphosphate-sugar epimerase
MGYFQGVDAVVHLAYRRGPSTGVGPGTGLDDYYHEKVNVDMSYNVYRAAYESGVRRVVAASSNHAADWYEHALIHDRKMEMLDPYQLPLSDNFYGWSKATYEHMGFLFACGAFGRKLEVVLVRIGYTRGRPPQEVLPEDFPNDPAAYKRHLGAYISQRDLSQLFTRTIEAPNIENDHGIPWLIVYGISDNARSFWSLTSARRVLGYKPEDDSEVKYAKDIHKLLTAEGIAGGVGRVGS